MRNRSRAKKPETFGKGKVTPIQVAFIVDRYLLDNKYSETRSVFRTEASSLISNSPVREVPILHFVKHLCFIFLPTGFWFLLGNLRIFVGFLLFDRHPRACWVWGRCWTNISVWRSRRWWWIRKGSDWSKRNAGSRRSCRACKLSWTLTIPVEPSRRSWISPAALPDRRLWRFHNQSHEIVLLQVQP